MARMGTAGILLFLRVFFLAVPGIQSTPSIVLVSSTSAVVPTQSLIYGACTPPGEYINASSGHISSPNFPNNYEANRTCIWNITVFIGKIIKLIFLSFTLVASENSNCTGAAAGSARVFITNVASHEGNLDDFEICGQELPPPVYSKGNSIQVRFESRNGTVNKGFNATFEAIDGDSSVLGSYGTTISVSSEVSSSVPGIQSTPSLPLDGSTSAVVPSTILNSASESSFGTTVGVSSQVSSSVPDIQSTASLVLDGSTSTVVPLPSLISASESSFGTTVGVSSEVSSSVPSIQSTSSVILNSSTPAVVPTQSPISEACTPPGEYINVSSGHISSLNFPHNYEANRTCTWNITVLSGKIIKLTFLNFTLVADEEGDCTGAAADSARVFITNVASHDGNPDDFKICGQTLPHPVYSKGNSIQVRFESRNSILNKGFKATFEAIDGDSLCPTDMILNETSGSFSSPFYPRNYPFNQTCSWKIIGKQGYRVELTIPDYNLQPCGGAACSCDYMEVQNSFSDEALPGKLCAAPTTFPVKFYSLHESLRVVFVSDDANMGYYGFSATYKLLNYSPPICPKEAIPLSGSGKISSTNYPKSNYTASRNCTWNITAPADKIVKFTFTDLVLSECSASPCSDSCSYVELYDGGSTTTLLGRFCQSSSWNESQFSSGNQMFVMFHPGKTVDRGFEAKYESATTNAIPPASIMYPYGPQQEDNEFGLDDFPYYYSDLCLRINTDWTGIPFFSERLYKLYICRNGLIQLDFEWSWWWPRKFGIYWWLRNMGIIAPFWAITDTYLPFKYNHSKVYYQVYSQTQNKSSEILDLATRHVQDYIEGFGDFRANWVLVVTWEKLCPYSYYSYYYYSSEQNFQLNCPRSNTFQAVLITNGFNTFLMYNYPSKGIQWLVKADPEYYRYWTDFYGLPVAGWNAGNDGKNFVNLKGSGTFGLSDLDKEVGNTGLVGRHFWRIENSDGQGALEKCLSWVLQNKAWKFLERYNELIKSDSEMACPCTGWQAIFDWGRFRWNWWNSWPEFCFESRSFRSFKINTTSGPLDFQLRQKCCYSTDWQDWGSLKRGPPDGGRVDVTFRYDSNNSFYTDEQAYKSCCVDSLNCRLFYDLRPSDSCSNYVPRPRRWFWGDPHIKTLDGGNYTFNGLGEYTMVDAKNGTFKLQARTKLAQGNSTTATIFSAGAAKEENSSTIEVRVKDGGGFDILIDSASYDGYNDLTNQSVDVGGNLSFSKPKENCLQVSFLSTSSVQFCEKKEMMSFVVTLGNDFKNATKGLLGTWNGDPKDDFALPDGTVLPSSSTLSEIHFHFGVKWQINQFQSLFTYANNESVATFSKLDFMPMFADNITWHNDSLRQKAEAQCGDDHECLFDVASTKDLSIGSATKEISVQLVNDTKKLNNFPPKIENTSEVINVTLHEIVELNITAVDDGAITFRVINKPVGATWNQTGAVLLFYWNVTSSKKFSLTFVAVDDQDASAIWSPTIKMCACQHDGQCVEPEEGDANNTDSKFIYMGCECQGGYTGRFCDRDIDACEVNGQPCYAGVDCTDLPPPANSSGYKCGPCPSGYTGDGAQCVDIDECQSNPCKQKCVNVPASFFCDCDDGYKLNDDGRSCGDIDECYPTNDCMQKCNNSVGSYNCSCDEYFKTDPTDWRKCVAKDPCTSGHGCSHVCFKGSSGRATCACYANFELQSDGKTCKDINECDPAKKLHRCSQTCINIEGSYKCSCTEGYELKEDGYECEDINECLNDDLYNCTDNFHKCVNTRGSYKCECHQDLYFIDGKCKGLEKNQEPPKQPPPKPKNASENEKEQAVQFSIPSRAEWDLNRDKNFKEVLASVASKFCRKNRTKCGLKNARRKRRSLYDIYTADEVHLLPGYPKNSSDSLQVAFYVKQPAGGFIGNNSVLHRDTLVAIIITHKSDIEKAIGANITDIETLFKPSTTTESPTAGPAKPADDDWKWIVIGVVIGVVVIILIGLLIFCIRKRKRDVKPITDPSQEGIAAQQSEEGKQF